MLSLVNIIENRVKIYSYLYSYIIVLYCIYILYRKELKSALEF